MLAASGNKQWIIKFCFKYKNKKSFERKQIEALPLLHGSRGMIEPGQISGDGPVVTSIPSGELQRYKLCYAGLKVTAQGVLIQVVRGYRFTISLQTKHIYPLNKKHIVFVITHNSMIIRFYSSNAICQ